MKCLVLMKMTWLTFWCNISIQRLKATEGLLTLQKRTLGLLCHNNLTSLSPHYSILLVDSLTELTTCERLKLVSCAVANIS